MSRAWVAGWADATMKYPPVSEDREYLAGWDEGMRYRRHKAMAALGELIERNAR